MTLAISIPQSALAAFCQHYHIRKMLLFGSALRADFGLDSDVDVLVEFDPEHVPGWEIVSIQDELSALLGYPVDLGTPNSLSPYIRDQVMANVQVIYDASQ
jgi:hypothetical protein